MNVPIKNRFAQLLDEKQKSEDRFIPLAEVAGETRISRKTLYAWEKNIITRYDPKVIDALCEYFGVGLSELLDHIPPPKKKK
jgi:transcriptional regulator with XRE-family HTH domain